MRALSVKKKRENFTCVGKKRQTAVCQEELPTHKSDKCQLQFIATARISSPRFRYVASYFGLCVCSFFFFNGGKNVLFNGCCCILSSSRLIGLENSLAHSPGLIGIKHKHMEWRRALAAGLTAAINVCKCNHIRKNVCVSASVLGFLGFLCAHGRRSTLSKQGQRKPVISFRVGGGNGTSFFSPPNV